MDMPFDEAPSKPLAYNEKGRLDEAALGLRAQQGWTAGQARHDWMLTELVTGGM
jgi:hypothetical protein